MTPDDLVSAASPYVAWMDVHRLKGASWEISLSFDDDGTPVDFSGCTGECQIRATAGGTVVFTFSTVTCGADGTVTLSATPAETSPLEPGTYVYDVDLTTSTSRSLPLFGGKFKIENEVTA